MIKIWILVGIVVLGIANISTGKDKPQEPSRNYGEYTQCMNDPNTHFMAALHQEKYKTLSIRQISAVLCDKK